MKLNLNDKILISVIGLLLVFFSNFLIPSHTNGFQKNINLSFSNIWDNPIADETVFERFNNSEFRRRPFLLESQKIAKTKFNLPYQFSFNLINYLSLFILLLYLPLLKSKITYNNSGGMITQIIFITSMPILFAFYGSIHSYDDFLQYLFIVLFLINLFNHNHILAITLFTISIVARETSLIYYMIVIAFFIIEDFNNKKRKLILWGLPIVIYYLFITNYLPLEISIKSKEYLISTRFGHWSSNFLKLNSFREASTIIFLMTGLFIFFLRNKYKKETNNKQKKWLITAILFIILNCILVSISALVRESRLLFLPLIFAIPLIESEFINSTKYIKSKYLKTPLLIKIIIIMIGFLISIIWYKPITTGTGYIFKAYSFLYIVFFLFLIYFRKKRKNIIKPPNKNKP